ncbi:DUF6527 family protein [Aquipseudomonas alcaligenes]|uniref:DUF6527 family protein n=1 Tax=Aquipseudomonas alcaligenes TaxID=43263 RepID=UPI003C7D99D8
MDYATAVHSCCCGCGDRVVTPFTPTDWRMTFDGESISLHPSVGNWNQKCRSHYVIQRGRVLEAGPWSQGQIEAERLRDKKAKAEHYGSLHEARRELPGSATGGQSETAHSRSIWTRLKAWLSL